VNLQITVVAVLVASTFSAGAQASTRGETAGHMNEQKMRAVAEYLMGL
jgi:hypothetical protein